MRKLMWGLRKEPEAKVAESFATHLMVSTPAPGTRSVGGGYADRNWKQRWNLYWMVAPTTPLIPVIRSYAYPMYASDEFWAKIGPPTDLELWRRLRRKVDNRLRALSAARESIDLISHVYSLVDVELYGDGRKKWRDTVDPIHVCQAIMDEWPMADYSVPLSRSRELYSLPSRFLVNLAGQPITPAYTPRNSLNNGMSQIVIVADGADNPHGYYSTGEAADLIQRDEHDLLLWPSGDTVAVAEQLAKRLEKS